MEYTKRLNDMGCYDVTLSDGDLSLNFMFGGNGDLYWMFQDRRTIDPEVCNFIITKENYFIYSLFDTLYRDIEDSHVFDVDPLELELCFSADERRDYIRRVEEMNKDYKEREFYHKLFSNRVISFHSDEEPYDVGTIMNIYKEDETFRVEFIPSKSDDYEFRSVRIRNSGSTYHPFNCVFMKMYNGLQEYDPDYHQIHIEEYLYKQKVKR